MFSPKGQAGKRLAGAWGQICVLGRRILHRSHCHEMIKQGGWNKPHETERCGLHELAHGRGDKDP